MKYFNAAFIISVVLLAFVVACTNTGKLVVDDPVKLNPLYQSCTKLSGTYDPQYKECSGITKDQCESINGTFNECGSACRHDPNATLCTMQCVIYCQMN